MTRKKRAFQDRQGARADAKLSIGLVGATGSGKTYSALRLAEGLRDGMQAPADSIFVIDTEGTGNNWRALLYADQFKFQHVPFEAPYSPLDYVDAINYCVGRNASVIVVDSMSHAHEGEGGLLDTHDREVERIGSKDLRAWVAPKAEQRALLNRMQQVGTHMVFCFRAQESLLMGEEDQRQAKHSKDGGQRQAKHSKDGGQRQAKHSKKDVREGGWKAITDAKFLYELTVCLLLTPRCMGVPERQPTRPLERVLDKVPGFLEHAFPAGQALSQRTGLALAAWARGGPMAVPLAPPDDLEIDGLCKRIIAEGETDELREAIKETWRSMSEIQRSRIRTATVERRANEKGEQI